MIKNDKQLAIVRAQLARAEAALEVIRQEVRPQNENMYRLMAESYIEVVLSHRVEIDAYMGIETIPETAAIVIALEGDRVGLGHTSAGAVTRLVAMQVEGYRIKKIDIADDDGLAIHYAPHPTGDGFPDYAGQLLQTITSNLGIPTDVITAEPMSSGRSEAIIHMQMFNDRVKAYEAALREAFRPAILVLHKAFVRFSDAFYNAACLLYREQVGRLPGSERTSRLRKKRRDRVLAWYLDEYLPAAQKDPQ